ncbi:MAG: ribose-phosphate pyrophosphokinase, partial [Candidatus Electrothrix sp. AR4]|nr:ribose-phosphate pyrophosphokinase [Candidatus Electrothrix sp. AR4]
MPNIMKVFTGNAHPEIAREICNYLDMPLSGAEVKQFSDGEISVEIGENVRGTDVFVIQQRDSMMYTVSSRIVGMFFGNGGGMAKNGLLLL